MSNFEQHYKTLLKETLQDGELCNNRTNVKTYKQFNKSLNINLQQGFPVLTGKKLFFEKALAEFKWIYEGRNENGQRDAKDFFRRLHPDFADCRPGSRDQRAFRIRKR